MLPSENSTNSKGFLIPLSIAIAFAAFVSLSGGALTTIGPWYESLVKPVWQPPNWVFAPVWTAIYVLCVASAVFAWRGAPIRSTGLLVAILFVLSGLLNVLWSALFFHFQRPDLALWECLALWLSIVALIVAALRCSRVAAWLLAPYGLWVTFALYLNYTIVRLNPPYA